MPYYIVRDGALWRLCWRDDGSFVVTRNQDLQTSWPMIYATKPGPNGSLVLGLPTILSTK